MDETLELVSLRTRESEYLDHLTLSGNLYLLMLPLDVIEVNWNHEINVT